jgi:hypothetical protein
MHNLFTSKAEQTSVSKRGIAPQMQGWRAERTEIIRRKTRAEKDPVNKF